MKVPIEYLSGFHLAAVRKHMPFRLYNQPKAMRRAKRHQIHYVNKRWLHGVALVDWMPDIHRLATQPTAARDGRSQVMPSFRKVAPARGHQRDTLGRVLGYHVLLREMKLEGGRGGRVSGPRIRRFHPPFRFASARFTLGVRSSLHPMKWHQHFAPVLVRYRHSAG